MGSLWIIDIHWWLLWGPATRERSCLGTADRGPCDVGGNSCWRWHFFMPLSFQDFRVSVPNFSNRDSAKKWGRLMKLLDNCRLLQGEYAPFESFWLDAYAWATPGVSWAMGATAECFRLSWGIGSGTWPVNNVLLFIFIYWDTRIWAQARRNIQSVRDSSFRISGLRRVADGWNR